ncbi:uncharacterized protein LOC126837637 [Adelges cooleyi]|uniref:uncharacterized protein LOC126837637 n=1 Tax=Adelges cooleyi TaxID=133065 RepID=UPI002180786B|nr:uncharacterized protein LOC126837637 [Adelges cooleyi]
MAMVIDECDENYEEILQQCINSQKELQKEITDLLGVTVSEKGLLRAAVRCLPCTCDSIDSYGFVELQQERTKLTRDVIQLSINLASRQGHVDFGDCCMMCRLKGVLSSILYPNKFIVEAKVDGDKCHLKDINDKTYEANCIGDD